MVLLETLPATVETFSAACFVVIIDKLLVNIFNAQMVLQLFNDLNTEL